MSENNISSRIIKGDYQNEINKFNELINLGILSKDQINALIIIKKTVDSFMVEDEKKPIKDYVKKYQFKNIPNMINLQSNKDIIVPKINNIYKLESNKNNKYRFQN